MKDLKIVPKYNEDNNFVGFYISVIHNDEVFLFDATHKYLSYLHRDIILPTIMSGTDKELINGLRGELIASIKELYNKTLIESLSITPKYNNVYVATLYGEEYVFKLLKQLGGVKIVCLYNAISAEEYVLEAIICYAHDNKILDFPETQKLISTVQIQENLEVDRCDGKVIRTTYFVYKICGETNLIKEDENQRRFISLGDKIKLPIIEYDFDNYIFPIIDTTGDGNVLQIAELLVKEGDK